MEAVVLRPRAAAGALEEAVRVARLEARQHGAVARVEQGHAERAGQEGAHLPAVADAMRAEHGERVAVPPAADELDLGVGQHARQPSARGSTPQMPVAYSRMLRSDENAPIAATLAMARRVHAAGSRNSASTRSCAAR